MVETSYDRDAIATKAISSRHSPDAIFRLFDVGNCLIIAKTTKDTFPLFSLQHTAACFIPDVNIHARYVVYVTSVPFFHPSFLRLFICFHPNAPKWQGNKTTQTTPLLCLPSLVSYNAVWPGDISNFRHQYIVIQPSSPCRHGTPSFSCM